MVQTSLKRWACVSVGHPQSARKRWAIGPSQSSRIHMSFHMAFCLVLILKHRTFVTQCGMKYEMESSEA